MAAHRDPLGVMTNTEHSRRAVLRAATVGVAAGGLTLAGGGAAQARNRKEVRRRVRDRHRRERHPWRDRRAVLARAPHRRSGPAGSPRHRRPARPRLPVPAGPGIPGDPTVTDGRHRTGRLRRRGATVRTVAEFGPTVILYGGSMGGATLNRVGNAVPHLIDRIVYDTAFCCVDLACPEDYLTTP